MSVRKSLAYSFLDRYASLLIGIVSTMVLARLLTPAELGVFSVAMAMLAMAATVRDMGAGNYLLQEKELTTDRIRAVWALQLGLGGALALLVAALSSPAARFYDEPAMRWVMLLLALNYLINPLGSLTYAWLMREMRYDAVAIMRFSSTLAGAAVSITLAWQGHGAISLAWGSLCTTAVNAGVSVFYRPRHFPWMPGVQELRRVLAFGTRLTASSIMTTLSKASPDFLLGKLQGMASAGLYSRANGLVELFGRLVTDAIFPVALSMFSKQARSGNGFSDEFLRALSYITVLSWSFCLALALLAQPTIALLYGPQWGGAVELTRWLAAAAAMLAPVSLCTAALVGSGNVGQMIKATGFSAATTILAALAGAWLGLDYLGPCLLAAAALNGACWLIVTRPCAGFAWRGLLRQLAHGGRIALLAGLAPLGVVLWWGWSPPHPLAAALLGWSGMALGFGLSAMAMNHPIGTEVGRLASMAAARLRHL